ncbi:hypothetical protein N499_1289 [Wolbachia pipientis wVitA]|nr:hypothetical protein N499_1289 [Wolbachia pipientis wVitA]
MLMLKYNVREEMSKVTLKHSNFCFFLDISTVLSHIKNI